MESKAPRVEKKVTVEELAENLKQEFAKFNILVARKMEIDNLLNNREAGLLSTDPGKKSGLSKEEKEVLREERKSVAEKVEFQRSVYIEVKFKLRNSFPDSSDIITQILYS